MTHASEDPRLVIGKRIAQARQDRKISLGGLAAAAEMDLSNLRSIEAGSNPRLVTLLRIAGVLEIDLSELFADLDPYALPSPPTRLSDFDDQFWRPGDRLAEL